MHRLLHTLLFSCIFLWACQTTMTADWQAETVVEDFYYEWTAYQGNPMTERVFADSQFLTDEFIELLEINVGNVGFDPIVCADRLPESFTIESISQKNEDEAAVEVLEEFDGETIEIYVTLRRINGTWKIDGITCPAVDTSSLSSTVR